MRCGAIWWCVFAVMVLAVVGCNEVTTPTTAPLILTVTGRLVADDPVAPVAGVQVCETDNASNCVMTDAEGEATIELPIGETSYTLQKKGHPSYLVPQVHPASGAESVWPMGLEQYFADQHGNMMSPWPMRGTGTVSLAAEPRFAGATFDLMRATRRAYYTDEDWKWRPDLTATTFRGEGGFVEVSPGEFEVSLGGTANDCVPSLSWPGNAANSFRFPVRENFITWVSVVCPPPSTMQLRVTVREAVEGSVSPPGSSGLLLEGAEVCQTDTTNCATSDANGEARLTLPNNQEISYTVTKDGYVPHLRGDVSHDTLSSGAFMVSDAQMEALAEDLGIQYPLTGGWLAVRASSARAGATYDLLDGTAKGYYNDEAGSPTLGLTATTSNGGGGFLEVTPGERGEREIDFGGTATNCVVGRGWPADIDTANRIKLPVKAGHITWGSMWCDEP